MKTAIFGDYIKTISPKTKIQAKAFLEEGKFPIVSQEAKSINGFWDNEDDLIRVKKPVIIFGDHTRVIKYIDFDFVPGADGTKILDPPDEMNPRYLYYWLLANPVKSLGYSRHFRILKDCEILIPSPEEQRRVVKRLDAAFEKIDRAIKLTEKNINYTKNVFENFLHSKMNNPDWELVKLPEISTYFNGLTYKPSDVSDSGLIVLRSSNIQNDNLDFNDIVRVNSQVKEKLIVVQGDILMCSRNGSKRLIGKTAIIDNNDETMTFGTFMMLVKSELNHYLIWFFKSNLFRSQIFKGEATQINQITRYILDDVSVPIPPKDQVAEVAEHFSKIFLSTRKAQTTYEKKLRKLESLKQSMLQQAFSGDGVQ